MHSTLIPKQTDDPHDFVVVPPDAVRVAPADEELSNLVRDLARRSSDPQTHMPSDFAAAPVPPVDTGFRPSVVTDVSGAGRQGPIGKLVGRTFTALLLAGCTGVAAIAWQSYGQTAKAMIAEWTPPGVLTALPLEKLGLAVPSTPPAAEATAANAAPPQAAMLAQTAPEAVAPNAAAVPADAAPSLDRMARDLASAQQEIGQLKASIAELKASQQQISRDAAKTVSDQNARARMAALLPRPPIARPRKPVPTYPAAQTYPPAPVATAPTSAPVAAPYAPRQVDPLPPAAASPPADPELSSVPRPPLPVR
jgi:hypothetical protein